MAQSARSGKPDPEGPASDAPETIRRHNVLV
jgi:hypothetical protein